MKKNEIVKENLLDKIQNNETKKLAFELLQCFEVGAYSAVIINLWTLVICDICYKLLELDNIYSINKATTIINWIETEKNKQKDGFVDSNWEFDIIKKVKNEFGNDFISDSLFIDLECLKKYRNSSAHPILNENFKLETPNKEIAKGLIKLIFEKLFYQPALRSDNFINELVIALEKNKMVFLNDSEKLERFLYEVFFKNATNITKLKTFETLWKFVFKKDDFKCIENQDINVKAIIQITKFDLELYKEEIKSNSAKYRFIFDRGDETSNCFLKFIFEVESIIESFDIVTKDLVNNTISNDLDNLINYGMKLLDENSFASQLIKLYSNIFDDETLIRSAGYAIFKDNYENEHLLLIEKNLNLLIVFLRKKQISFEYLEPLFQKVIDNYLNSDCFAISNCRATILVKLIPFISEDITKKFVIDFINSTNSQLTFESEIIKEININFPDLINNIIFQELISLLTNEDKQNDEFDLYQKIKKFFFMLIENEENIDIIIDKIIKEVGNKSFIKENIEKIGPYIIAPKLKEFITGIKLKLS